MKNYKLLALGALLFLSKPVMAGIMFNYSQLALKDVEQMSKLIQAKIEEARKSGGNKVIPLKEGLQAVYSRSNEDFMIEKIISPLKSELEEYNAWEKSIQNLVKEAIGALKNPKAFQPIIQVTYVIFLENIMAEMRPRVGESFEGRIVRIIRDAKIEVSKAADTERRLRVMKGVQSPSVIASSILTEFEEAAKAEAKLKAKIEAEAKSKSDAAAKTNAGAKPKSETKTKADEESNSLPEDSE